ncbi:MAG: tRNA (adenosine(37)-N6)-dimethylallyltransferase MiaA [Balneolaceae bacterium]|nr:tRNA (adenosine(37)-N6)-dimethylallyltransferase MiaA [Balneolaceae bacterium]
MEYRFMIAGPTASGKTALSIDLATQINAEIISVDSRQCYRYLDIGTAKPTKSEQSEIPHHNISVLNPDQEDSVADFLKRAEVYTKDIKSRGKRVIYCGGSTLHLQSLIRPLDDIPSANPENIRKLNDKADNQGLESLFSQLQKTDPEYAKKMDGLNRQRIIRALDVWYQTGKSFSSFHSDEPLEPPNDLLVFALHHPRKELHQRISVRTEQMLEQGFLNEVKSLLQQGFSPDLQAMNTVGYRQAISYLKEEISFDQMKKEIKTATRRYAKRQITWLRRWPFLTWLDMDRLSTQEVIKTILSYQNQPD